ncbi:hypothetical protein BD31_I0339 [Candidatus Nitrosopumilus salaria BD31]|uniref:Uncharacterized protein n=1 Tax=Candidatus Nitrosopumilus salarius BD31 TaxID=859350 RepID=I3D3H1_9ARCH|nr:hypothetical protein BD31_I0339 [Candidatus Nitrosopumilus salaria BD31]
MKKVLINFLINNKPAWEFTELLIQNYISDYVSIQILNNNFILANNYGILLCLN